MATATDVPSQNAHDGHPIDIARGPGFLRQSLIAICIAGGLLAGAGWMLGLYEIVSPETTASSLLLSVIIAPAWLLTLLFAARRLASMARWAVILLGTAACWGGPILAWRVFVWQPTLSFDLGPRITGLYLSLSMGVTLGLLLTLVFATHRLTYATRWVVILLGMGLCWNGLIVVGDMFAWETIRSYEHEVPRFAGIYLWLSMAIALGWLLTIGLAARRRASRSHWIVMLVGTAVCWGGPLLAGYVYVWDPVRKMRDMNNWYLKTEAEVRSVCHRSLVWNPDPHDEFLHLRGCGDNSSLPYLIWAFRRRLDDDMGCCTWDHGLEALETITNRSARATRSASAVGREWSQWYAANTHWTRIEWWADGFTAEGYPVSATGGEESIRSLLRAWGRTPWCQPDDKRWLSWNARRMLELMSEKDSRHAIDEVLRNGSVQERCGLARYAERMDRVDAESILRELLQNDRRLVRLTASGILSRLQLEWLKNPPGFIEKRLEPHSVSDDEFFSPAGAKVVAATVGTHHDAYRPMKGDPGSRIEAVPAASEQPGRPKCVIRIEWPAEDSVKSISDDVATVSIDGVSPATGEMVYSKEIIATDGAGELRWLYDPDGDSLYVSVPDFTCKIDPKMGQTIWEMGFGTGNINDIYLLESYLVVNHGGHLVICDAARGGVLAYYDHAPTHELFHHERVSLVDGRLRVKAFDGGLCVLNLPETVASSGVSSPLAQQEK